MEGFAGVICRHAAVRGRIIPPCGVVEGELGNGGDQLEFGRRCSPPSAILVMAPFAVVWRETEAFRGGPAQSSAGGDRLGFGWRCFPPSSQIWHQTATGSDLAGDTPRSTQFWQVNCVVQG